ncbi:uncharacterized protein K460DRAFT_394346 [Cucurbitaria berberidis CBS 394.84]|uniref:Major facilitator superfamily (MFS) profile domain-containing protein n=1 Tax=Cucurbitaria berberidis CBS 394.84 TaxID=1168544 RepID=A0A9P4GN73_9PLEO|nr:uncharacterized protein K460DRAFT_394346 [Cucurbitaria berberidis CBS 394.84]KAF1849543.1 hypothetical protein K460DRAFT_394346 [Cucurbitaria berberidis CBS 394.84]
MVTLHNVESKEDMQIHSEEPSPTGDASFIPQHASGRRRSSFIDVDNPLRGVELEVAVQRFAIETGLSSLYPVLLRGAYLAEDPDNYHNIEGLSETDVNALKCEDEETKPLKILAKVSKQLRTIIITCSVAAITQGWDQVSMSAANQYWPPELGLDMHQNRDIWLFGFINACSFLCAGLVGAWLSDPLNEYLMGRRSVIFVAAIFSLIPMIGAAVCQNWIQLLICRLLLGIGMGCKAAVVPIYAAETAPTKIRGGVVMNWQLSVAIGGVLGSSFNLALFDIEKLNWRLQLAVAALPAIPLLFLIYTCPESPRFLIKKRKWRMAFESLKNLNQTEVQAARELFLIHVQNELTQIKWYGKEKSEELLNNLFPRATEDELTRGTKKSDDKALTIKAILNEKAGTYIKRLANLFTVPRIRRATTAAAVVMISQQLCGINVIGFYSGTILPAPNPDDPNSVKSSNRHGLWLGWGSWMIGMIMAIPAFMTIDRWGRRTLCLVSTPVLGLCLFAGGFCFWLEPDTPAYLGSLFFLIFLFTAAYPPGLGVVPFTYSAEVFPTVNREAGMSLAVFINLFGAGILGLFVPWLQDSLGALGLFELFAGLNVLAFALIFIFVYETKQERLEKIDNIFEIPVGTHLKYQLTAVIPWCFRRVFRRRRNKRANLDSLVLWNKKRNRRVVSDDESSIRSEDTGT